MDAPPNYPKFLSVTIWCPELGKEVTTTSAYIYASGCMGHGPEEYCYCDNDKYLEINCECKDSRGHGRMHEVRVY